MEHSKNLVPHLVDEVVERLTECKTVPLPGGHGVFFPTLRRLGIAPADPPPFDVRAFLVLVLEGGKVEDDTAASDRKESWTRKHWWMLVNLWFDEHCPELLKKLGAPALAPPAQPWEYFLAALAVIAHGVVSRSNLMPIDEADMILEIDGLFKVACDRIRDLNLKRKPVPPQVEETTVKDSKRDPVLPKLDGDTVGTRLSEMAMTKEWEAACETLIAGGTKADLMLMMYFLHTYHASLGIPQPEIDRCNPGAQEFYARILELLEWHPEFQTPGKSDVALRIASALSRTAVLNSKDSKTRLEPTAPLAYALPTCFREANIRTRTPWRSMVFAHLRSRPEVQRQILAAHDCALIFANAAIDYVRAAEAHPLAFEWVPEEGKNQYRYAYSLVKTGKAKYARKFERTTATAPQDDDDASGPVDKPMTLSFAREMARGALIKDCAEVLVKLQKPQSISALFGTGK